MFGCPANFLVGNGQTFRAKLLKICNFAYLIPAYKKSYKRALLG